jgi:hypothetical protein
MPTIDGFEIPESIVKRMQECIELLTDKDVLAYVRKDASVAQGYQVTKKHARTFRTRIKRLVAVPGPFAPELLALVTRESLSADLTRFLSSEVLQHLFTDLLTAINAGDVYLAYLVDERPAVRRLAIDALQDETVPPERTDETIPKACEAVLEMLEPLMESAMLLVGRTERSFDDVEVSKSDLLEEAADDAWLEKEEGYLKQIKSLEAQVKADHRDAQKRERKATKSQQQLNEKLQRFERDLKQERQAHKQIRDELHAAQTRADSAEAALDTEVATGIEQGLQAHTRDWLHEPRRVEAAAKGLAEPGAADDVLEQVQAALSKQAERDRHVGNLRVLRERLAQLESAEQGVLDARQEALNPIAELPQVEAALQREILRIRAVLGERVPLSRHAQALCAQINEADDPAALEALLNRLEALGDLDVLPARELRELYTAYHSKMARMYDRFTTYLSERKQPASSSWLFKRSIDANDPFIWVLDGHNVLFCLDDLFGVDPQTGVPGSEARDKLVAAMTRMGAEAPNSEIYVFFDSPKREERHVSANVTTIYSGGGDESQRADRAIIDHVGMLAQQRHGVPRVLVTDDRQLATDARAGGTGTMRLAEFAAVLTEALDLD